MDNTPEWLIPYVTPYKKWMDEQRRNPVPTQDREKAKEFVSLNDVSLWLAHPDNWFNGYLDIIRWDGLVPSISAAHAWKLAPGCPERDMLLSVVIYLQKARRRGRIENEVRTADAEEV